MREKWVTRSVRLAVPTVEAVSALASALSREPDEAIYEAAYAVGTPEKLRGLTS
jgi:hypothetical protein